MSAAMKNRALKFGLPPGTLLKPANSALEKPKIILYGLTPDALVEEKDISIQASFSLLNTNAVSWINIQGTQDLQMFEQLGQYFNLHPLLLEDILNSGQMSKLDDYQSVLFIVLRVFYYDEKTYSLEDEQVSLILGDNFVISFSERTRDVFNPIRERIKSSKSRLRSFGSDYLCYALIDCIVDHHFVVLEKIEERVDKIDEEVFNRPTPKTMYKIQRLKRKIITLRKGVGPLREMISQLRRMETTLITEKIKVYLHDIYDHTIQAIDTIDSFRDITSGMLEGYLSNISFRTNETMKVLTIVSTIFVPLTFIASIYGMNFENIPELHSQYGYYVVLGVMAATLIGMLTYFRRKGWI